jgi:hypothetical protein
MYKISCGARAHTCAQLVDGEIIGWHCSGEIIGMRTSRAEAEGAIYLGVIMNVH